MSRQRPSSCIGCACFSMGTDFSQPEGIGTNGTLVLAEASGEMEARDQLPLRPYSAAGGVYERTLRRLGMNRDQFITSNMLRCRPRQNLLSGMNYEQAAIQHCTPNLEELYFRMKPRVIIALGNVPFSWLTGEGGPGRTVSHCRGYLFPLSASYSTRMAKDADDRGVVVMPTYHPSHIRRGATELSGVLARDIARAVNIAAGKDEAFVLGDPLWALYREELDYAIEPSEDELWAFVRLLRDNHGLAYDYDIETYETASGDLDEDMAEEFSDTRIRQIQLSVKDGHGIAMPWNETTRRVAAAVFALPNEASGWNNWQFDDRVLRVAGEATGQPRLFLPRGPNHDAMQMWRRYQPELPANLQYAASFVRFPFTWKHLAGEHLPFYGCCDSDATGRLRRMLMHALRSRGLYDQYVVQVARLHDLPARVAHYGVMVSQESAKVVESGLIDQQARLQERLEALYPESERTFTPEEGYKRVPKQVQERQALWASEQRGILIGERTVLDYESESDYVTRITGLIERQFIVPVKDPVTTMTTKQPVTRWCKRDSVSPRSRAQIIRYAKLRRHEIPQADKGDGTKADSLKLSDIDLMFGRTRDEFYWLIGEWRRAEEEKEVARGLVSMARNGTLHPVWRVEQDGRLSARGMPMPQPGSPSFGAIVARPGKVFVKWSWPGQREAILAQLCGSPALMEAVKTGDLWRLPGVAPEAVEGFLRGDSDRAILDANRRVFGSSLKSITGMRQVFSARFPEVAKWQAKVLDEAHRVGASSGIVNRFGELRWFYEPKRPDGKGGWAAGDQAGAAIRFAPESEAAGTMKARLGSLVTKGMDEKWSLCTVARDWIAFEVSSDRLKEHIKELWAMLGEKMEQLGGLDLVMEVWAGQSLGAMVKLDIRGK